MHTHSVNWAMQRQDGEYGILGPTACCSREPRHRSPGPRAQSPRQTRLEMDVRERSSTRNADALETWLPPQLPQANEGGEICPSRMKRHIPRAALGFVANKGGTLGAPNLEMDPGNPDNRTAVLGWPPLGKCWKLLRTPYINKRGAVGDGALRDMLAVWSGSGLCNSGTRCCSCSKPPRGLLSHLLCC